MIEHKLCHTGQHFDKNMSDVFFEELEIPPPDYNLGVPPSTPVAQVAEIMLRIERVLLEYKPDIVLVPGDVNSTFAAAFAAQRLGFRVGHVESGLRSFDKSMPEEHNRILTDAISDLLFVTEEAGRLNLLREGKAGDCIHFVGNTMIDTIVAFQNKIDNSNILSKVDVVPREYALMTMHRPATVDSEQGISWLLEVLDIVGGRCPVVFPIHPRTKKSLQKSLSFSALMNNGNVRACDPMGYIDFQSLVRNAMVVITDSGGIQEETTFYGVPCITLRANTERPVTTTMGTNTLLYFDRVDFLSALVSYIEEIRGGTYKRGTRPPLWDGRATERVFSVLEAKASQWR